MRIIRAFHKVKSALILLLVALSIGRTYAQISSFIQVDQFGYLTNAEKVAVISSPIVGYNAALSYVPPATLEVRNNTTNATVFKGPVVAWNKGATHAQSGDQGWWFDFSALKTVGSYYIYDVTGKQKSAVFTIDANPYAAVMQAACKMFYYNRCNMAKAAPYALPKWVDGNNFSGPLQDSKCRYILDPLNVALEKDLSGGWFDAGDYNKYVSFSYSALQNLLYAYEENPAAFTDQFNIPESQNGIPDLLDEIKWELDWLSKMTNQDGTVHIKVGSKNYSENASSPPSINAKPRYYGPVCTSASVTVASVFAHASIVFGKIPAMVPFANQLRDKAIKCYNYLLPLYPAKLQTECDNGSIVAGDADLSVQQQRDMLISAAVYLFEKTSQETYNQFVINNYKLSTVFEDGFWSANSTELQDALIRYARLPRANATVKSSIMSLATDQVNYNDFFGWNELDLYRAYMPDWSYYWGSNQAKAEYGIINRSLAKAGIGNVASLNRKSAELLHYFHGVNPQGIVYLSNMYQYGAEKSANEIFHKWFANGTPYDNAIKSPKGPAPGYLVGGPNKDYCIKTQTPPYGQPQQKSYLDFNTDYPNESWVITEPAIYYQAAYIRLLAHYTSKPAGPLPVQLVDFQVRYIDEKSVKIDWKTASEVNNDHFEIERSVDGVTFYKIGDVAGSQTSHTENQYGVIDRELPQVKRLYYRLKQVDLDGEFEISKVRSLYGEGTEVFGVRPNPVSESIELTIPEDLLPLEVMITDVGGHIVLKKQITDLTPISVSGIPTGIYLLHLEKDFEKLYVKRIFKN